MPELKWDSFIVDGNYQPKRKNQWYIQFDTGLAIETAMLKSSGLPSGSFGVIEVDYINQKHYFPGKWSWDEIEMSLRDFVGHSTAQVIYNWWRSNMYNPETGVQAYGNIVKKSVDIFLMAPDGNVIETWTLMGAFPIKVDWGDDLDYKEEGERTLNITWRYDRAELIPSTVNPAVPNTVVSPNTVVR
jgi:hypothetical protein